MLSQYVNVIIRSAVRQETHLAAPWAWAGSRSRMRRMLHEAPSLSRSSPRWKYSTVAVLGSRSASWCHQIPVSYNNRSADWCKSTNHGSLNNFIIGIITHTHKHTWMRGRFSVSYAIIRKKYEVAVILNVLKLLSGSQTTISVEYSLNIYSS